MKQQSSIYVRFFPLDSVALMPFWCSQLVIFSFFTNYTLSMPQELNYFHFKCTEDFVFRRRKFHTFRHSIKGEQSDWSCKIIDSLLLFFNCIAQLFNCSAFLWQQRFIFLWLFLDRSIYFVQISSFANVDVAEFFFYIFRAGSLNEVNLLMAWINWRWSRTFFFLYSRLKRVIWIILGLFTGEKVFFWEGFTSGKRWIVHVLVYVSFSCNNRIN